MMNEKRFERWNDHSCKVKDNQEDTLLNWEDVVQKLNELVTKYHKLEKENEELKQKLDFYLLDEFEWKEKYGDCDE